jgi:hypothetical protein
VTLVTPRIRRFLVAAGLGLVSVAVVLPWWGFHDFQTYQLAIERVLSGGELYAAYQLSGPYSLIDVVGSGFVYPPSAVPVLVWTPAVIPVVAVLLMMIGMLWVALAITQHAPMWAQAVAVALLGFSPLAWDAIASGQITPLLAMCLGMVWITRRGEWAVVAAAIKVFPIVWLAFTARSRRIGPMLGPLALALGIGAAATVVVGAEGWSQFATVLRNGEAWCAFPSLGSFPCAGVPAAGYVLTAAAVAGALLVRDERMAFLLVAIGSIAASPDIYPNYLLIPAMGLLPYLAGEPHSSRTDASGGSTWAPSSGGTARP